MEGKKLIVLAAGILVVAFVVLAAAFVVLSNNGSPSATPTPAPEVTPAPTASASAATPAPTAKPASAASTTPAPGGAIIMQTNYNRTMNMCFVSMFLNTGATPVDTGSLKMDIVSGGQTYRNVWTPKAADWASSDGDALLEPNEVLATQIDTKALGIPQGQPITIRLVQDSAILQETTASPT